MFILIYFFSRFIIRCLSNYKRPKYEVNTKVCQAFVISSNQYGSFRPIQSLYRSDSLFSNINFALTNEKINTGTIHLTINPDLNFTEKIQYQQTKSSLLEHYLQTYNPLRIDLTNTHNETITTSNVKVTSVEEISSETDTYPVDNCYSLYCTNKQRLYQTGQYTRLKEQENCSATISIGDERLSECSTKLTSTTLPVVMVTDCSNSKRLHTDIIEMIEEE